MQYPRPRLTADFKVFLNFSYLVINFGAADRQLICGPQKSNNVHLSKAIQFMVINYMQPGMLS